MRSKLTAVNTPGHDTTNMDAIVEQMRSDMLASAAGTLMERMEIELVEVTPQRLVGRMPVAGNTQPYGLLHGGASAVLAETLGSAGSAIHAAANGRIPVGIELSCTHHRAARSSFVTGVATPLSIGRTLATWHIEIRDDEDRLICTSRLTCLLREGAPGA